MNPQIVMHVPIPVPSPSADEVDEKSGEHYVVGREAENDKSQGIGEEHPVDDAVVNMHTCINSVVEKYPQSQACGGIVVHFSAASPVELLLQLLNALHHLLPVLLLQQAPNDRVLYKHRLGDSLQYVQKRLAQIEAFVNAESLVEGENRSSQIHEQEHHRINNRPIVP